MSTAAPQRPSWLLKLVIILSASTQTLAFTVPMPLLSRMAADLARGPADAYMVKMVMGVIGPAIVAGAALGGLLVDKGPRRATMVGAGILFALAGAAPFILRNLPAILATRFLLGMAATAVATVGTALVGDCFDETRRPAWTGALGAAALAAGVLSLPAAGVIGEIGWRYAYLLYLLGLPIAALALVGMRTAPRGGAAPTAAASDAASAGAPRAISARNYPFEIFAMAFLNGALFTLPTVYLSFYVKKFGVDDPTLVSGLLTTSSLVAAVFAVLYGRVRKRLSSTALFGIAFALGGASLAMLALAPSVLVAEAAMVVLGVASGWFTPNLFAAILDTVDEHHRGRASGITYASAAIGPAVGITALEPLVARIGVDGVFLLLAGLCIVTAAGAVIGRVGRPRLAPAS